MATMTEGRTATTATSRRKRSRTEVSADDDGDKRRGRPRVDKQDESAADRRRTQIRMAQRAYRQRKESTLEELRGRVSDLTNTIELMNKSFNDFSVRFHTMGLAPAQRTELEGLSQRFEVLVKDARNPADDTTSATPIGIKSSSTISPPGELEAADPIPQVKNVPSWLDQSAVSSVANRPKPALTDIGLGYTMWNGDGGGDVQDLELSMLTKDLVPTSNAQPMASPQGIDFANAYFIDDLDLFPISRQPSPPRTFSFQESTFARRLHRACLEQAYQLLLDPDTRPASYERVFRLSLLGRSRMKILNVIKIVLARGPHQDLTFWEAAMIHVGGAGTHYAPRDAFGNMLPKRRARNIGKISPQTLALLDNATREQISFKLSVEIAGYEGEWFDPDDVQGYLEERGVFIDSTSTFAEADLSVEAQDSNGVSTASSARALTPAMGDENLDPDVSILDADAAQWDGFFSGVSLMGVGFSDTQTGSFMNFLQPGDAIKKTFTSNSTATTPSRLWADGWMDPTGDAQDLSLVSLTPSRGRQARTKKVVVDVRKLVKVLSASGVCLGRSPGFRRKDVDHALQLAIVEAL